MTVGSIFFFDTTISETAHTRTNRCDKKAEGSQETSNLPCKLTGQSRRVDTTIKQYLTPNGNSAGRGTVTDSWEAPGCSRCALKRNRPAASRLVQGQETAASVIQVRAPHQASKQHDRALSASTRLRNPIAARGRARCAGRIRKSSFSNLFTCRNAFGIFIR